MTNEITGAIHGVAIVRQEHRFTLLYDDGTPWSALRAALSAWVNEPTLPFFACDVHEVLQQLVASAPDSPPTPSAGIFLNPEP